MALFAPLVIGTGLQFFLAGFVHQALRVDPIWVAPGGWGVAGLWAAWGWLMGCMASVTLSVVVARRSRLTELSRVTWGAVGLGLAACLVTGLGHSRYLVPAWPLVGALLGGGVGPWLLSALYPSDR